MPPNGINHHIAGLLNGYPSRDKAEMHVEPEINGNVEPEINGNVDHDMDVLCEDARPVSAAHIEKLPTKLSIPQRCMGSHFM